MSVMRADLTQYGNLICPDLIQYGKGHDFVIPLNMKLVHSRLFNFNRPCRGGK